MFRAIVPVLDFVVVVVLVAALQLDVVVIGFAGFLLTPLGRVVVLVLIRAARILRGLCRREAGLWSGEGSALPVASNVTTPTAPAAASRPPSIKPAGLLPKP